MSTLIDPSVKLMLNNGIPISQLEYSKAIGSLMYAMTSTRLDISFVVGKLSRYTSNPSAQHWQAVNRVFKYLKGTMDYGLSYLGNPSVLEGGGAISRASKKRSYITNSTMEYEFVMLAAGGNEVEWLRNLVYEIPLWSKSIAPISIFCDSAVALAKAYNQVLNQIVLGCSDLEATCTKDQNVTKEDADKDVAIENEFDKMNILFEDIPPIEIGVSF
uniref:Zinc finger, CCHC-type n=1 Tax=Lactuca sativa TaxID=4236 RepID=A0A9R1UJP7_LACSA|nr:hypothetical protein LSAT_V11C900476130 [Lactuca sativa]